ncbi:MAG TPA: glycosyltransferase, partial [Thermoanaerobaculia bacterium]|nr:glycosyltransferase [Thermoanaerobaculia bacterium]
MKVALVHDWLTGTRGGEKVLLQLARLFPKAPLFTLFHFPGSVPPEVEDRTIETTWLQHVVSRERDYRSLLPLYFLAAESWDLSGFDLVISTSHCVAKAAKRGPKGYHLCYCHTPVRYLHDQFDDYLRGRGLLVKAAARLVRAPLRARDVATVPRVDAFVANSQNVRERIARIYGRPSRVVPAPADTAFYTPAPSPHRREGILVVSALAPYKRLDDALEASSRLGQPLTIAGFGPGESRLRAIAGPNVRFAGSPSDEELRELYRSAEVVLMPGEEDFGIVPLEAQACGTPVVALGKGGALETVVDGVTGVLYPEAGAGPLARAIELARARRFDTDALVENARRFSEAAFRVRFLEAARSALAESGRDDLARA